MKVTEGIKHFEPNRPTCLATDWSKSGLGFFLLQKHCHCKITGPRCCEDGWNLVLAGGRFTTPAESRYSPTEGELLAVADSLHKARHFVLGCKHLIVAVDHLPLLGILNSKSLADIHNPRILALKEKTLWFRSSGWWRLSATPPMMGSFQQICAAIRAYVRTSTCRMVSQCTRGVSLSPAASGVRC